MKIKFPVENSLLDIEHFSFQFPVEHSLLNIENSPEARHAI